MSAAVSLTRWNEAQKAEQLYWDRMRGDVPEFGRVLAEKPAAAARFRVVAEESRKLESLADAVGRAQRPVLPCERRGR